MRRSRVVGSRGFIPTSVIHDNIPLLLGVRLWEALFVVSQIRGFHVQQPSRG